ncbi:hypothetical protein AKO1_000939, partial [Acrasis kona]
MPLLPPVINRPTVVVYICDTPFNVGCDSFADQSCISTTALESLPKDSYVMSHQNITVTGITGVPVTGPVVVLNLRHNDKQLTIPFAAIDSPESYVLLGWNLINMLDLDIPRPPREDMDRLLKQYQVPCLDSMINSDALLNSDGIEYHPDHAVLVPKIQSMIDENLATADTHSTIGEIPIIFLDPKSRSEQCYSAQHRMSESEAIGYKNQITDWLNRGIIEKFDELKPADTDPDNIPAGLFNTQSFPIKSGSKTRYVQNFVPINKLIRDDTNVVPSIDEAFQAISLVEPTIYSKLDLRSAYLQVPLRECDRSITAITCDRERYRFVTAPLGLKHIPSMFQRLIRAQLQYHDCLSFSYNHIDDIIIFSTNVEDHVEHVQRVLKALTL